MELITLVSNDGWVFTIDAKVAKCSQVLTQMLDILEDDEKGSKENVILLPKVDGSTLKNVIVWCTRHLNDPPPQNLKRTYMGQLTVPQKRELVKLGKWDTKFFQEMENRKIYDFILAGNYLDIPRLIDTGCRVIAAKIRGKKPAEILENISPTPVGPKEPEQVAPLDLSKPKEPEPELARRYSCFIHDHAVFGNLYPIVLYIEPGQLFSMFRPASHVGVGTGFVPGPPQPM